MLAKYLFSALFVLFTLASGAKGQALEEAASPQPSPPNIVFIFADDLGYGDIGAFGATDIRTPNIDLIAERGAKFTQFYSASPVCTPSRAALLTGRLPVRMGIHHVFNQASYRGMPEEEVTIAELLRDNGYATGIFGKWHLGHQPTYLPLNQGFDEFAGIPYSNDMSPLPWMEGNDFVENSIDQTELTGRITDAAIDFIERHKAEPFFIYIPQPMPHVPLYRSEAFEGVSDRGLYGDVIEELDASVGEIIQALEDAGVADQTLFVFTSDNGPWLYMGETGGSSGPLRNGKGTTFEGGMRVPTVAMYPARIPPGEVYDAPATMLDWVPTIASLAGASIPSGIEIDGTDISLELTGNRASEPSDRPFAFYSHGRLEALRMGDWKLKRPYSTEGHPLPAPLRMFLGGEIGLDAHDTLLFNLADDPGERKNLAKSNPDKVAELEALMVEFETRIGQTPANITPIGLEVSPAMGVLMSAVMKLLLSVFGIILLLIAALAFWIGRVSRKRTQPSAE